MIRHRTIHRTILSSLCLACIVATSLAAQEEPRRSPPLAVLGGASLAFLGHESGHLAFDLVFHAHPYLLPVHFGPIPFFAIEHRTVSNGREYAIASAGFWVQESMNEWILSRHPRLRSEPHAVLKGMVAFNTIMPIGYSMAAIFRFGPKERDPSSIASSSGLPEPAIGALVLAPALLDGYRYFHPDQKWAAWASRALKVGSVLLVVRAANH